MHRILFLFLLLISSQISFGQSKKIDTLTISGTFKLDKGHNGHNIICILDAEKKDTIQVLSYAADKLLQKGLYSLSLPINRNYLLYFAADGYEDIWKPLKASVSTMLPRNKKSIESQQLNYNINLNMGTNKEFFVNYNKVSGKFEIKLK